MIRVVFFGMDLGVLKALRSSQVHLIGAYLPPAYYWLSKRLAPLVNILPRFLKKYFKTAIIYGQLYDFLKEYHITPLQSPDVNSPKFLQTLTGLNLDLGIVANFGQIIGDELLNIPKYGFINYHPSLLPKYRGPSPLGHILLNNEKISGATWHRMTKKIDDGDILAQESFSIKPHSTMKDLGAKSLSLAIKMLFPLLKDIEEGNIHPRPQNEADSSYFPKLTKEEKRLLENRGKPLPEDI
jgi:methionyl-tRNA formyltransferase